MAHISRGSRYCLLDVVLTMPPLTTAEDFSGVPRLGWLREKQDSRFRPVQSGGASLRAPWVCRRVIGLNGQYVDPLDKKHPCYMGHWYLELGATVDLADY